MIKGLRRSVAVAAIASALLGLPALQGEAQAAIGCGSVIMASTTLTSDVGPCPTNGLIVGADNVTLDLGGHRVVGVGHAHDAPRSGVGFAGIRLRGRTGVLVRNGTVARFDAGVEVVGGSMNRITGLYIHDNIGPADLSADLGDGVFILNSPDNVLQDSRIVHNGRFDGVGIFGAGSTGNRVERNLIDRNDVAFNFGGELVSIEYGINLGVGLAGSSRTMITHNVVRASGLDGIVVCSEAGIPCVSTDNVISDNVVTGNGFSYGNACLECGFGEGIRIVSLTDNGTPNVFEDDTTAIPTRNLVRRNLVRGNAGEGIFVGSLQNRILDNVAVHNGTLTGSFDLMDISASQVFPNLPPCDENVWFGNAYGTAFPDCTTTGGRQLSAGSSSSPGGVTGERSTVAHRAWPASGTQRSSPSAHAAGRRGP